MQRLKQEMTAKYVSEPTPAEAATSTGRVYWITGLSGAGKTTVGRELWRRLRAAGHSVILLDGDVTREVIAEDLGHSTSHRRSSEMRNARLCRLLSNQGTDVVCTTISLFHEVQRWNRENIPGYREIYLRVPMEELQRRDSKGIYAASNRGDLRDVVGLDVPAELPEAPDLTLDNFGTLDSSSAVERIWMECVMSDATRAARSVGTLSFGTKAETLEALAPHLRTARILPQVRFSVAEWHADPGRVLAKIAAKLWG